MPITNSLLVRTAYGWDEVTRPSSIATHGRREALYGLGSYNSPADVARVANARLDIVAEPRYQYDAEHKPPTDAELAYHGYDVGDTLPVTTPAGSTTTERVMSIAVSEDENTGQATVTTSLHDVVLYASPLENFVAMLAQAGKKMIPGTGRGDWKEAQPVTPPAIPPPTVAGVLGTRIPTYDGVWSSIAMRPRSSQGYTAFATAGRVFVAGNSSGPTAPHLDEYLPGSDSFIERATPPNAAVGSAAGSMPWCAYDPRTNCAYFMGTSSGVTVSFMKYNVGTDTWTAGLALPSTPRFQCGAAVLDGKVYMIGGIPVGGGAGSAAVDRYDPDTNTWSSVAALPAAAYNNVAAVTGDHVLRVWTVNHRYDYNAAANTWTNVGGGVGSSGAPLGAVIPTGDVPLTPRIGGGQWRIFRYRVPDLFVIPDGFDNNTDGWGVCAALDYTVYCWGLSSAQKLVLTPHT